MLKRVLFVLWMWATFALAAFGQSTTVSGTVTDSGAQSWNNGTYSFNFVPNPQYPNSTYTWTGGAFNSNAPINGSLSGTGTYSVSIPSNANISPINSQWNVTFCPQATAANGCYTTAANTIFGATQTLNATPPAIKVNSAQNVVPLAYADSEIVGAVVGTSYYNSVLASTRVCTAVSAGACSTWASSGGGGTGSGAAPIMGYYFGSNCPAANTFQCFFTAANTQIASDCSWATTGTTVTCSSSHFVAGDVGKRVMGYIATSGLTPLTGCIADRIAFGSMTGGATSYTIASFISGTQISVSANPLVNAASNACLIWGTPDDANASALEASYSTLAGVCPRVMLAAASYWFDSPHFYTQPAGCIPQVPLVAAATNFGNLFLPAGFELEGRGPGSTQIYLGNLFPNGDSCAHVSGGAADTGCFAIPVMGKWADFGITGGGQSACNLANNANLITMNVATMQNVTLTNMCFGSSGSIRQGIVANQLSQLYMVNNSGFGEGCFTAQSSGAIQAFRLVCENAPRTGLIVNGAAGTSTYTFQCEFCYFVGAAQGFNTRQFDITINPSSVVRLFGTFIGPSPVSNYSAPGGITELITNNGGTLYCDQCAENLSLANSQSVLGLHDTAVAAVNYLTGSTLNSANGQPSYTFDSFGQGTLYDLGGNKFNAGTVTFSPNNVIADGHSLTGSCTGVATASSTLGLYGTGPNATTTTCTSTTLGTGVVMTQARTLSTLICTSSATTVSVACTVLVNGSPSTLTCTMTAATRCDDYAAGHAVSVNKGDLISEKIVTGAAETGANVQAFVLWE